MWEKVDQQTKKCTWRAKVPGGWLVTLVHKGTVGMAFYPDPTHEWQVTKKDLTKF